MPLSTDLSVSPYHDDYDEKKNYYKILFQPGVSVQTRELNQLQTLLQKQIERFGDNIYYSGTILSGCNFDFDGNYKYVKIKDLDTDGFQAVPSSYVGLYAETPNGTKAFIRNYRDGFEMTDPDLKTLYVKYIGVGANGQATFNAADTLRISDRKSSIYSVTIANSGSTYSNSDPLVVVSAIAVNNIAGLGFEVGDTISQVSTNARAVVYEVNTSIYTDRTVLKIKPHDTDISNTILLTTPWSFANGGAISTPDTTGTIVDIFGSGATGRVLTDSAGRVVQVVIRNGGTDYRIAPYATVRPTVTSTATTTGLSLVARNYIADVTVASTANAVGNAYAMSVTEGVIFQKGYFIRVEPQTLIVSPYDAFPDQKNVVFETKEEIVTSDVDPSLNDNASGEENDTAPGAHRMKLTPQLTVVDQFASDTLTDSTNRLILVSFSEGLPYVQNQTTKFNAVETEMARRTADSAGDFVLDRFNATTRTATNTQNINNVSVVVEPGRGYIDGHRVETLTNYVGDLKKGIDTETVNSVTISLNYGNYIRVNEVGGSFQYATGDQVTFYDTAKRFASNTALSIAGNTDAVGSIVATASIRSMVFESGTPGTNSATYRLYLFNVIPAVGKSFSQAKSVRYANGSITGIADVITQLNPTSNTQIASIQRADDSKLVFSPQVGHIRQVSNVTYTYRTCNTTASISNNGTLTQSVVAYPERRFPYSGSLTAGQMLDLYIVPRANCQYAANLTGTVSANTTTANLIGSGTTFSTDLTPGDWVKIANATANTVRQVVSVVNNTLAILDANCSGEFTSSGLYRFFPHNVPVPFGMRSWLTANVNPNSAILTLNFGNTLAGATSIDATAGYNVQVTNAVPGTKTATRNSIVKIYTGNNAGGSEGPWCLGVADVVRLRGVYISNSTSATPNTAAAITQYFYVDNNHDPDKAGLCWLYRDPAARYNVATTYMLVAFDHAVESIDGFYATESYTTANLTTILNNDVALSNTLGSTMSTWEVPEFVSSKGDYYDMMSYLDFRPIVTATANVATVTLNPNTTQSISTAVDQLFPLPDSTLTAKIEYYTSRVDAVVVDVYSSIKTIAGSPSLSNPRPPKTPRKTMVIDQLLVPAYPTLPSYPSSNASNAYMTMMGSDKPNIQRLEASKIRTVMSKAPSTDTQPVGFSMARIAELERRISSLEYYVSLNSLETSVAQQSIPSSISQNLSRFKYGFYADDYSTVAFSEVNDTEWSATVNLSKHRMYPKSEKINLPHGGVDYPRFVEYEYISQPVATHPDAPKPCNLVANVVVTNSHVGRHHVPGHCHHHHHWWWWWWHHHHHIHPPHHPADVLHVRMAEVSANVTLRIFGHPKIMVFQGNTVIKQEVDYVDFEEHDWHFCHNHHFFMHHSHHHWHIKHWWWCHHTHWVWFHHNHSCHDSHKITWTHNPANGLDYTIVVLPDYFIHGFWDCRHHHHHEHHHWRYVLEYPISSKTYYDCANTGGDPLPKPVPAPVPIDPHCPVPWWILLLHWLFHRIHCHIHPCMISHHHWHHHCHHHWLDDYPWWHHCHGHVVPDCTLRFRFRALQPWCTWRFFIEEEEHTPYCRPTYGRIGHTLRCDEGGFLDFDCHWSPTRGMKHSLDLARFYQHHAPPPAGYKRCLLVDSTGTHYHYMIINISTGSPENPSTLSVASLTSQGEAAPSSFVGSTPIALLPAPKG